MTKLSETNATNLWVALLVLDLIFTHCLMA
ncbi:MAG: hypothetical protein ACI905_002359 [Roseivirga sp.]